MTIAKKITASLIAAGIALSGSAAVANAQSSNLFDALSSSNSTPTPSEPDYADFREQLKQIAIEGEERSGTTVTDEANAIAQELSEALIAGASYSELQEIADENGGRFYVNTIPNVLLESRIDSHVRLNDNMFPYFADISGVGVSGNESTTYVVGFFLD